MASSLDAWNIATRRQFGWGSYDAVTQSGKRRMASPNLRSEDRELLSAHRRQLQAQSRDQMRNFSIARWAVGKHLDFVSRFSFTSQTKTPFDYEFQARMNEWMNEPRLCDVTARHTFARILRMTEARAVLDGDHLLVKVAGQRLQQIESDRIRSALLRPLGRVVHGVIQDDAGAAVAYQVHARGPNGSGYELQREIPAEHCMFHAYYPAERADQTRGIGLITAGINDFIDAYEWTGIAKATEKARAAMAMIFKTTSDDAVGEYTDWGRGKYKVGFGHGPIKMELDKDDEVEFLSSQTPAGNTVAFFNGCIGFALKSLDIPLCFFDETLTNFFGQRAQFILYIESCKSKRENLRTNILNPLARWLARCWIADGTLTLPPGVTSTTLGRLPFAWRAAGLPWWNPVQEVTAALMSIRGGLANYEDVYLEATGRDWFEDMLRLKEQQQFLTDHGITLDPALAPAMAAFLTGQQQQQDQQQQGFSPLSELPVAGDLTV
ncbi:MAG: phage portal protein [Planctomycetes bacterium]|nr:phage portal protein [Planctomycetota bacterium]